MNIKPIKPAIFMQKFLKSSQKVPLLINQWSESEEKRLVKWD